MPSQTSPCVDENVQLGVKPTLANRRMNHPFPDARLVTWENVSRNVSSLPATKTTGPMTKGPDDIVRVSLGHQDPEKTDLMVGFFMPVV